MTSRATAFFLSLTLAICLVSDAWAATKKRTKRRASRGVPVTVDVGAGPAAFFLFGPVMDDQTAHWGVRLDAFGIIPEAVWKKELRKRPKKQRRMARGLKGDLRVRPLWFLPSSFIISPKTKNTGIYGVNFRPLGLGVALSEAPRFDIGAAVALSYAYIDSDTLPDTHFLRPGLDLKAELELPLGKKAAVSLGWSSTFYPPQALGGDILAWGEPDESIWHIGQAFLLFHYRFPYNYKM